ncbi:MAG: hypothetical protein LBC74_04020 [Planctomycetaceae bacterium]|jgi:hypothetical protein|nr:hypothetical protein [Planctomycetaceae bacterium]
MRVISSANKSAEVQSGVQIGGGFTVQQWVLLVFAFFLGIASVMTVDKIFLTNSSHVGTVHAGAVLESEVNTIPDK